MVKVCLALDRLVSPSPSKFFTSPEMDSKGPVPREHLFFSPFVPPVYKLSVLPSAEALSSPWSLGLIRRRILKSAVPLALLISSTHGVLK